MGRRSLLVSAEPEHIYIMNLTTYIAYIALSSQHIPPRHQAGHPSGSRALPLQPHDPRHCQVPRLSPLSLYISS